MYLSRRITKLSTKLIMALSLVLALYALYSWIEEGMKYDAEIYSKYNNWNVKVDTYSFEDSSVKQKTDAGSNTVQTILDAAKNVSSFNKTVLVTLINDAYMPFAFSWLCNTQSMKIHEAVLVVTTSETAAIKLKTTWPNIHVVPINVGLAADKQDYSTPGYLRIMIRRSELFQVLIEAGYEVMLFEFDYVWFKNPVPTLQKMNNVDLLVNPVSKTNNKVVNGGLIYLFPTNRTTVLWKELTRRLVILGRQIQKKSAAARVSEKTNDQTYLSMLVYSRYANVVTRELPLDVYADGIWYSTSKEQRKLRKPVMIGNNWVIGNDNKIKRAKEFGHWFLKEDGSCDTDQVHRAITKAT